MKYDIELRSSGDRWMGMFAQIIRTTVMDILNDAPYSPVEVTTNDETYTGTLDYWTNEHTFTITEDGKLPRVIETDDVLGFRA